MRRSSGLLAAEDWRFFVMERAEEGIVKLMRNLSDLTPLKSWKPFKVSESVIINFMMSCSCP